VTEEKFVSATQRPGPDGLEKRIERRPRQAQGTENAQLVALHPLRDGFKCWAQKGKGRLRSIQAAAPAAQSGRGRHAIRIFERRSGVFPGTALYKAPTQSLASRYQAVMGIGSESWKEADCHTAVLTLAATIADPVVTAVMRLFGPPAEALNLVVLTQRT
jgi:hypothetical protein